MICPLSNIPNTGLKTSSIAMMIPDTVWYESNDFFGFKPTNTETMIIGGLENYFFMTTIMLSVRFLSGNNSNRFLNTITEPYILLARMILRSPPSPINISMAGCIVLLLSTSTRVLGYDMNKSSVQRKI